MLDLMSRCRVMGTSVNLKNRFAGYNIELVVREDSIQQIMDIVGTQLPGGCDCMSSPFIIDNRVNEY